jgi:putative membrane protein
MEHLLMHFAVLVGAFLLMPLVPGVRLKGLGTAITCALVFSLVNFFFGWFFKAMWVIGTLGLALLALNFLTNLVVLWVTDKLVDDFEIRSFGSLLMSTLLLSAANWVSVHYVP